MSPPGRPKGSHRSARREDAPVTPRLALGRPATAGPVRRAAAAWALLCGGALGLALPAAADPMRPLNPPPAASAAASAPAPAAPRSAAALPRLVAIRDDGEGRLQALFGEQWVRVGGRLGEHAVQAITAREVTLTSGKTRQVLHLLPPLQAASQDTTAEAGSTTVARTDTRRRQRRQGSMTP
jgi:hypothetical protein